MVPEEESTTANKAAVGSTVLAYGEEQPNPTEHKKMALINDNMEGETSPLPEVTPTKDLEIANNIDLNKIGTEMVSENNQDSAPENVTIGNPDLVSSKEKLEFIKHLHEVIEKLELKAPQKKLTTRSRLPTGKGSK